MRDWSSDVCSSDLGQVRVAEGGVVAGVDLAVEPGQLAGLEDRQRVELHQPQVLLVEQLVQAQHELGQLVELLGGQAQGEAHEIGRASCRERVSQSEWIAV